MLPFWATYTDWLSEGIRIEWPGTTETITNKELLWRTIQMHANFWSEDNDDRPHIGEGQKLHSTLCYTIKPTIPGWPTDTLLKSHEAQKKKHIARNCQQCHIIVSVNAPGHRHCQFLAMCFNLLSNKDFSEPRTLPPLFTPISKVVCSRAFSASVVDLIWHQIWQLRFLMQVYTSLSLPSMIFFKKSGTKSFQLSPLPLAWKYLIRQIKCSFNHDRGNSWGVTSPFLRTPWQYVTQRYWFFLLWQENVVSFPKKGWF